jgi:tetratricopeptide (TPR) repeat protein
MVGGGAALAALLDRSLLPVAAPVMIAVAAGAGRSLARSVGRRGTWVAVAALVACAGTLFRNGAPDVAYQLSKVAGWGSRDPHSFLWVSLQNTDRELVRFVASRTSVRESFLAPDDLSALLLAFSGRTIVALPGGLSKAPAERQVELTRVLYRSEEELYQLCHDQRIDYVLYSVDVLLDTGRYSPRYRAGVRSIDPESVAFQMHFEPESLRRFTLLYENDHYRLFDVTGSPQPIFATDHPPFYQPALLAKANRDVEAFRRLAVEIMLTYADAVNARARGNAEGARRRLEWCLLQAPRFSMARLALADALMDLDRYDDARRVVAKLIEYAPDNTQALYYSAYVNAYLGRMDEAKPYLTLLLSLERDPEMLRRARALQAMVEQGIRPRPGPPRDG